MSDRIMEWLDESQRLADKATAGPWEYMTNETPDGENLYFTIEDSEQESVAETNGSYQGRADAEFIAESRTRLPQAVAALREVAKLHQPSPYSYPDGSAPCRECNRSDSTGLAPTWWPCPTLRAVTEALGLEGDEQ